MSKSKSQKIIIIRHAHRNKKSGDDIDNGLSKKGVNQAKAIKKFFEKNFKGTKPAVFSSPKRRCVETVERIAKQNKVKIQTPSFLDEGGNIEEHVDQLLSSLGKIKSPLVVVCSHGDVIPNLLQKMIGAPLELDKGGWVQIDHKENQFDLEWFFQNFDFK